MRGSKVVPEVETFGADGEDAAAVSFGADGEAATGVTENGRGPSATGNGFVRGMVDRVSTAVTELVRQDTVREQRREDGDHGSLNILLLSRVKVRMPGSTPWCHSRIL